MTKTISELLQWGGQQILQAGYEESARLEAEVILAFVLQKDRSYLYAWPEKSTSEAELKQYQLSIEDRTKGKPVAYITGGQEFWSLRLKVTESTLIPRPETEKMVACVLDWFDKVESMTLLDAGTGSGAIALALASEKRGWQISACDLSMEALKVAQQNAESLGVSVRFFQSDWLSGIPECHYDVIVSNPPYICETDKHLPALSYEPRSALVAVDNGLADIHTIVRQATTVLREQGALFIEHGYNQGDAVKKIFIDAGFRHVVCEKDYAGNDRFTHGVKV